MPTGVNRHQSCVNAGVFGQVGKVLQLTNKAQALGALGREKEASKVYEIIRGYAPYSPFADVMSLLDQKRAELVEEDEDEESGKDDEWGQELDW